MAGVPRKFHTATWVDASLNGIVVMGGQANGIVVQPLAPVAVSDPRNSTWITVPVNLGALPSSDHNRYGHSAVSDGNGNIYIFGGIDSQGTVRNELFVLDTKQPRTNWALLFLLNAPEGRAFHTATLLPDNTMLIMWVSIDPSGVPRSNNGPTGESGPSSEKSNLPLIIAICVLGGVLLILIIGLALYFCYFKRHRRTLPALHPGMNPEKDPTTLTSEQQEDKADQIRVLMSGMQRTMDPDNGGRHYNSKDESYNRQDAAGNGLGRLGPRAPQFAAVLHGPQNVEGHLPPQYGVDLNALQYDAGSRAPQQNAEPHGPRHEFQYDMSPRAPHYGVDPIDHRMPQFGAHSGALLYAAESRAPQRVDLDRLNVDGNGHEHFPDVRYKYSNMLAK
ncbi:MAG: hypothetical protein J3Q66DRAFT_364183 [Benniella sp.]|nr:MAG: hypothetical protein J3Q66DRAFT_364183 [Benniella sp.]